MTPKQKADHLKIIFGEMALAAVTIIIDSKPSEPKDYSSTADYWNDVMLFICSENQNDRRNE